jgi:hypothetical protein
MQIGRNRSTSAITQVRDGMRVLDAAGTEIGSVEYIQMGDPDAVTTTGNDQSATDLMSQIAETVTFDESEPDVPHPLRISCGGLAISRLASVASREPIATFPVSTYAQSQAMWCG